MPPAPASSFRRMPESRGEGWHQPHPNTSNDQASFSYLGVPAPVGMSDCYESMSRTPIRDRPSELPLIVIRGVPSVIPAPHLVTAMKTDDPPPTRSGLLPLPRWERVGVRVKPAALKPVPSQWPGVSPFSSSYCGLRNAIVLPAAHFVITVKNGAQINLEGASPHPRLAEP